MSPLNKSVKFLYEREIHGAMFFFPEKSFEKLHDHVKALKQFHLEAWGEAIPELIASGLTGVGIDRLADLYATHLVEVTHLIHSSLDRKAQQFADAFKWRKDF